MRENCGKIAATTGAAAIAVLTTILVTDNGPVEYFFAAKVAFFLGVCSGKHFIAWLEKPDEQKCCFDTQQRFLVGLSARAAHAVDVNSYVQLQGQ